MSAGAATGCGVGTCDVIRSGGGSLECVTSAATGVAEEATLSLRVTRAGGGTGTGAAAAATYQLLTTAQSLTVESLSSATGSTLGGMKLCITGTNLGPSANGAAVAVSIGGDGTMLKSSKLASNHNVPITGINKGRLGFLTDINPELVSDALKEIIQGHYQIESRMLLDVKISNGNETRGS